MDGRRRRQLRALAYVLFGAAFGVLVLSLLAELMILSAGAFTFLEEDLQRQGKELGALMALGFGVFAAGILAGLGGILLTLLDPPR